LTKTILEWAGYQNEENRKPLEELVTANQAFGTIDGLCKALSKIGEHSPPDQVAIALCLKAKTYTDPVIAKGVWEVISNADWRLKVLTTIDPQVLGILIEAFSILQLYSGDDWFSFLPHYIAELCEKAEDEERRRILFFCVLHISLASDTVSAVRRLLRGDYKEKFIQLAEEYRKGIETIRSSLPPWVAGKIRGLVASLRVV
jgi:hypothetical protein